MNTYRHNLKYQAQALFLNFFFTQPKKAVLLLSVGVLSLSLCAAQQVQEQDFTDKINALKRELEETRQLRDRVLAKRWEDKRKHADSREVFNGQYEEHRIQLENANIDRERLEDQRQVLQTEVEALKASLETEKAQYQGLGFQLKSHVREWADISLAKNPLLVPQRQKQYNQLLEILDQQVSQPLMGWEKTLGVYQSEINLTREVVASQQEILLSEGATAQGWFLRLGAVGAAYADQASGRTGVLLRGGSNQAGRWVWREDLSPDTKKSLEELFNTIKAARSGQANWNFPLVPIDILQSQLAGAGYASSNKSIIESVKSEILSGGIWMIPLIGVGLIAFLLSLERFFTWWLVQRGTKSLSSILTSIAEEKWEAASKLLSVYPKHPAYRGLAAILEQRESNRQAAEKAWKEALLAVQHKLEKHLTTLSVLGATAPLLGLLGTVVGMIELFDIITLYGTNDPKLMAHGISVALVTTEAGLIIAIPTLLAHNFISNRVEGLLAIMEESGFKALNRIWPQG